MKRTNNGLRLVSLALAALVCGLWLLGAGAVRAETGELDAPDFPSLISAIRVQGPLDFCGEPTPLENQEVRERLEKELMLSLWGRPQVILWIKRSARYMPEITRMLKENGMPEDLRFVAVIESALRPHVGSPKGAIGFWQFMKPTGRNYGLQIDRNKDERRNIFASTRAAIRYFQDLHDMFGSWTLAAAGYNMGERGLQSKILAQETNDYYKLYLPLETQRFVFRILSAKLILSDPAKYGFHLKKEDLYPRLSFDRVKLVCNKEIPIRIIAGAAETHFKAIKDLNPELRGHHVSAGSHSLLIPDGSAEGFHERYVQIRDMWLNGKKQHTYVVKRGDNLSTIAKRFDVPLPSLFIWNRLPPNGVIHPGDRLIIFSGKDDEKASELK